MMKHCHKQVNFAFRQDGFSILETLIAGVIVAATALGLGMAISFLQKSRQKTEIVSQSIAVEAAIFTALQDPTNYKNAVAGSPNQTASTDLSNGNLPSTAFTISVMLEPAIPANPPLVPVDIPAKVFPITIYPNQPSTVQLDKNMNLCAGCPDWTVQASVSPVHKNPAGIFEYAYQIQGNPKLVNMASTGAANINSLAESDYTIIIPDASYDSSAATTCDPGSLAMSGIDKAKAYCLYPPQQKCPPKTIAKGYQLVPYSAKPGSYSVELNCSPIRFMTCPSQVMISNVASGVMGTNAYALQNFLPNNLDPNNVNPGTSGAAPSGTCIFLGKSTSDPQPVSPVTMPGGMGWDTGACPPHYHINQTTAGCTMLPDPYPGDLVCPDGATQTTPLPTKQISFPTVTSIQCQVVVTKVSCQSDPTIFKARSGTVTVAYQCDIDSNVDQTTPATYY